MFAYRPVPSTSRGWNGNGARANLAKLIQMRTWCNVDATAYMVVSDLMAVNIHNGAKVEGGVDPARIGGMEDTASHIITAPGGQQLYYSGSSGISIPI